MCRITSSFILLVMFASYTSHSQSLDEGLLMYLTVDGDFTDESIHNTVFTGVYEVAEDRLGNSAGALGFNGMNDYVDMGNPTVLKPELPVSFAFWLYMENTEATSAVFFVTDFGANMHSGAWMNISSNGRITLSYGDASGTATASSRRSKQGESVLDSHRWYYIVGVIRGPTDMDIYVDCENDGGTYNGTGGALGYTSASGSLGRKFGTNTGLPYYFHGRLDEFRYYGRALTELDVNRLCLLNLEMESEVTSVIELDNELSVEATSLKLGVFPNPARETIHVVIPEDRGYVDVVMLDLTGARVLEQRVSGPLDVSFVPNGTYILHLLNEPGTSVRVVISR